MVDYEINGDIVTNFKMVVADWASAYVRGGGEFYGGTPVYAGPNTFESFYTFDLAGKDLFSFGRLAMELMMDNTGTESKLYIYFHFSNKFRI